MRHGNNKYLYNDKDRAYKQTNKQTNETNTGRTTSGKTRCYFKTLLIFPFVFLSLFRLRDAESRARNPGKYDANKPDPRRSNREPETGERQSFRSKRTFVLC